MNISLTKSVLLLLGLAVNLSIQSGADDNSDDHMNWRISDRKRKELQREIEMFDDRIEVEMSLLANLKGYKDNFEDVVSESMYSPESTKINTIMDKITVAIKQHEETLKSTRRSLLESEESMESLWIDDDFRLAFDYVMSEAYLAPQPDRAYPKPTEKYNSFLAARNEFIVEEVQRMTNLSTKLKAFNGKLNEFEGFLLGAEIFPEILHEKMDSLKAFVESTANFSIPVTRGLAHEMKRTSYFSEAVQGNIKTFNKFQATQQEHWRLALETGYKENMAKFVTQASNSISTAQSSWSQRLVNKVSAVRKGGKSSSFSKLHNLIPEHLIEPSIQNLIYQEFKQQPDGPFAKNLKQINDYFASFKHGSGCECLLARYQEILEVFHRYLVKRSARDLFEVRPKTFYEGSADSISTGFDAYV